MSTVHALAAGYLLVFVLLLAYLLRHVTRLARLERRLDTIERQAQHAPRGALTGADVPSPAAATPAPRSAPQARVGC